jgi:hypothetical protein
MGTRREVCVFRGCVRGLRLVLELQQRRRAPAVIWFVAWHLLVAIGVWCLANGAVVVLYCAVVERGRRRQARWSARDDRLVRSECAAQGKRR